MSKWRPENWINPFLQQDKAGNYVDSRTFEAGADAILEALRKSSTCRYKRRGEEGESVHIPDDKPEKKSVPHGIYPSSFKPFYEGWNLVQGYWYQPKYKAHPATKVIEEGYFCPDCGRRRQNIVDFPNEICLLCKPDRGISY